MSHINDVLKKAFENFLPSGWSVTSGAAHVETQAGSVWTYGNWPQYVTLAADFTAGAADNAVLYTSGDVSTYNVHMIENLAASTNNMDVFGSLDGTNFNVTPLAVELMDDVTTGGGVKVVAIAPGKIGILRGKYKAIKVQQAGATDADGRILHGVE